MWHKQDERDMRYWQIRYLTLVIQVGLGDTSQESIAELEKAKKMVNLWRKAKHIAEQGVG